MIFKKCCKCKKNLSKTKFYKDRTSNSGLQNTCKKCRSLRSKEDHKKNPEKREQYYKDNKIKILKRTAMYYQKNKEEIIKRTSEYNKNNRKKIAPYSRKRKLKLSYNLSEEEFQNMYRKQEGKCKICAISKELVVDHLHNSNPVKIRGLLCRSCNLALGLFKDNLNTLSNAFKYIKDNQIK